MAVSCAYSSEFGLSAKIKTQHIGLFPTVMSFLLLFACTHNKTSQLKEIAGDLRSSVRDTRLSTSLIRIRPHHSYLSVPNLPKGTLRLTTRLTQPSSTACYQPLSVRRTSFIKINTNQKLASTYRQSSGLGNDARPRSPPPVGSPHRPPRVSYGLGTLMSLQQQQTYHRTVNHQQQQPLKRDRLPTQTCPIPTL